MRSLCFLFALISATGLAYAGDFNLNNRFINALRFSDVKTLKYALEDGADVNFQIKTPQGWHTPLRVAIQGGNPEIISILIENGADLELVSSDGETALHAASHFLRTQLMETFLRDKEISPNVRDIYGNTPLHTLAGIQYSTRKDPKLQLEAARLLLKAGASINAENDHFISLESNGFVMERLDHATPLHIAVARGELRFIDFLINEAKADISSIDNKHVITLLHYTVLRDKVFGKPDAIRAAVKLLRAGADPKKEVLIPTRIITSINRRYVSTQYMTADTWADRYGNHKLAKVLKHGKPFLCF